MGNEDSKIDLTPEEKTLLENNRKMREKVAECAKEIGDVLKKYNMRLETTKPEVVVVPNVNA